MLLSVSSRLQGVSSVFPRLYCICKKFLSSREVGCKLIGYYQKNSTFASHFKKCSCTCLRFYYINHHIISEGTTQILQPTPERNQGSTHLRGIKRSWNECTSRHKIGFCHGVGVEKSMVSWTCWTTFICLSRNKNYFALQWVSYKLQLKGSERPVT